jgi:molybdopterin molybdotransferase
VIDEKEARAQILHGIEPLPKREVALLAALGGFAAEDYFARVPLPGFDNSAMDGYAVVASSHAPGKSFRVIGEQPAGIDRALTVAAEEAVRIFTGAPIPRGADAIVMQEDVTRNGEEITINEKINPGDFIRRRGCDLAEGQKILAKGERIHAATLALVASQGFDRVTVGGRVEAGVISTGDEIVRPGARIEAGQIYESNSILLTALLAGIGAAAGTIQHCGDDKKALTAAIEQGAKHPVLIISGGVSVGEHDLVQDAVRALGGKIEIWRVAVKPGKPFLFGSLGDCSFFGLPGNPVSAFVTFLKFVRPAVLKMMGAGDSELELSRISARLAVDLQNDGDRVHYFRGKFESGSFMPVGRQESHALFGLSQSNALLRIPPGGRLTAGAPVEVEVWDL